MVRIVKLAKEEIMINRVKCLLFVIFIALALTAQSRPEDMGALEGQRGQFPMLPLSNTFLMLITTRLARALNPYILHKPLVKKRLNPRQISPFIKLKWLRLLIRKEWCLPCMLLLRLRLLRIIIFFTANTISIGTLVILFLTINIIFIRI